MVVYETWHCCSDHHGGPEGHPANDSTPGFREVWDATPAPKLRLGDMAEAYQFRRSQIPGWIGTDVAGNHDRRYSDKEVIVRGNTAFTHGYLLGDPLLFRHFERPIVWAVGQLEQHWPDIDLEASKWFQEHLMGGRRMGAAERYIDGAVKMAHRLGVTQVVFGHLHQRFEVEVGAVRVVCIGSCCNGQMDIVPIRVRVGQ